MYLQVGESAYTDPKFCMIYISGICLLRLAKRCRLHCNGRVRLPARLVRDTEAPVGGGSAQASIGEPANVMLMCDNSRILL